jgi:hypothetical protein
MEYAREHNLVLWWPRGVIGYAEVIAYYKGLLKYDWCSQANRFCDFSEIERFALNYQQVEQLAQFRMNRLKDHVNIKVAIFSRSDLGFAFGRMYQAVMDREPVAIWVSRDLAELAAWLGAPLVLLSAPSEDP